MYPKGSRPAQNARLSSSTAKANCSILRTEAFPCTANVLLLTNQSALLLNRPRGIHGRTHALTVALLL